MEIMEELLLSACANTFLGITGGILASIGLVFLAAASIYMILIYTLSLLVGSIIECLVKFIKKQAKTAFELSKNKKPELSARTN